MYRWLKVASPIIAAIWKGTVHHWMPTVQRLSTKTGQCQRYKEYEILPMNRIFGSDSARSIKDNRPPQWIMQPVDITARMVAGMMNRSGNRRQMPNSPAATGATGRVLPMRG
ncbi:hypothetical protein ASE49_14050 [Novosphingobium sp. Leaf2]|nr:hypothetical protein ASE49_14050 [Novosphingobium sp. Leaf2]